MISIDPSQNNAYAFSFVLNRVGRRLEFFYVLLVGGLNNRGEGEAGKRLQYVLSIIIILVIGGKRSFIL